MENVNKKENQQAEEIQDQQPQNIEEQPIPASEQDDPAATPQVESEADVPAGTIEEVAEPVAEKKEATPATDETETPQEGDTVIDTNKPQPRSEEMADEHEDEEDHHDDEHDEEDHHDLEEDIDFTELSKKEIYQFVVDAGKEPGVRNINKKVQQARGEYTRRIKEEREEMLEKWKAEGNEEADFAPKDDPLYQDFFSAFKTFKKNRQDFISDLNHQKEVNLQVKKEILERLKVLTEQDETGSSFDEFKALQDKWRSIGHVPIADAENIWNTYNFYVDRFYEQRSLYSEFKELDRKKNLAAKEEVVSRIEHLQQQEDMSEAMKTLRQLQEEWRHIGPVPKENLEELIQRYKSAVVELYEKRDKLSEELKVRREQNYEAKLALLEKIDEIAQFDSKRVQDWIDKNEELGQWIENWRSIGSVPRAKNPELKERFTSAVRTFNKSKNEFFRNRKKEKVDNLKQKIEMCEHVEGLLEAENHMDHKKEVIKLQDDWKKIGPVPAKYSDKVWKRFQAACDAFFAKISAQYNQQDKEQQDNLKKKKDIITRVEEFAAQENPEVTEDQIRDFQYEFNQIGFVPFKEKDRVKRNFQEALGKLLAKIKPESVEDGRSKETLSYQIMLEGWATESGGNRRLDQERNKHTRELRRIENEIATLENNMAFLSNSKGADKLKSNLEKQIGQLRHKMEDLQDKLDIIRSVGR